MNEVASSAVHDSLRQLTLLHSAVENGDVQQPFLDLLTRWFAPDFMTLVIGELRTERGAPIHEGSLLTATLIHAGLSLGTVELRRQAPYRSDDTALLETLAAHAAVAIHNA